MDQESKIYYRDYLDRLEEIAVKLGYELPREQDWIEKSETEISMTENLFGIFAWTKNLDYYYVDLIEHENCREVVVGIILENVGLFGGHLKYSWMEEL